MASDGPSKNELKKLAKKAAKKPQPTTSISGPTEVPTAKHSSATPALASTPSPPTWQLLNPSSTPSCLKVVWAMQLYGVKPSVASTTTTSHGFFGSDGSTALAICGASDQAVVVGGGGNAMAQAIALSHNTCLDFNDRWRMDEWCEWERTALRVQPRAPAAALQHLNSVLEGSRGLYLVGHQMTVADVCVLVTLSTIDTELLPEYVSQYVQAHAAELQSAHEALQALLKSNPVAVDVLSEPSLDTVLHSVFGAAIRDIFGPSVELPPHFVGKCVNCKHGDYQCNAAMPVFAALKKNAQLPASMQSPPNVAQAIVAKLGPDHPVVMDLQVQGPGFVLCRLRPNFLEHHINEFLKMGKLPFPNPKPQVCVVDFSSPNIAKEMHVGHLRSTIIGESVCRILEAVGHDVHRINHVGDWGTQFGMLIQYLKEEYPDIGEGERPNITDLTVFYKNAKERFDVSPEFKKTSQTNVVKLQAGDKECRKIWHLLCDISRLEFEKVYQRLDVTVVECGESFYNDRIPAVIDEFQKAGLLDSEEGGAKIVRVEGFQVPLMLQKSDGGYGYDSTDMAALKYRLQELKADRIIVITDFTQSDHFKMVYGAGRMIGWVDHQRLEHIGFGTVQGDDGKRFKTRSGDTVRLVDLLDEAVNRMERDLTERIKEGKANIALDEVHMVAEAIGYGAVKYYDLRRNPTSNYKFSYDQMLDTKGETAVYLLYCRVRLESIMAKAKTEHNVDVQDLLDAGERIVIGHESERNVALALQVFSDTIEQTLDDLLPYHICEYVYKLANSATDFVTQCKVLGSPEMKSRLLICHATVVAIHQCFDLLGIRHVKRI